MSINEKLATIQQLLKAPKGQYNSFGKYKYRNCEDILESVKPLLGSCVLTISDDIVMVGDRYYVKATASLRHADSSICVSAFAREALDKKGMDDSQITGSASSYARKYALNGLFAIDDTKDSDSDEQPKTKAHPNSVEARQAKESARDSDQFIQVLIGFLASEDQYDFAREALDEITDEKEKIRVWSLLNTREKEIVRSFSKKD